MSEEKQTQSDELQNKADGENDNSQEENDSQTTEDANDNESGDGVKKEEDDEENPYKAQIKKLEDINAKKERALQAEKKKRKELEGNKVDLSSLKDEILGEIRDSIKQDLTGLKSEIVEKVNEKELQNEIDRISNNPDEKKLIKIHYDSLKDNPLYEATVDRLRAAKLLANQEAILKEGIKRGRQEKEEDFMKGFISSDGQGAKNAISDDDEAQRLIKIVTSGNEKWQKAALNKLKK